MSESNWERGFLEPVAGLSPSQIEQAAEMALANATDLLAEADLLRASGRCARAFFLAHIACEEVGKLPILITTAVSERLGFDVDWNRIDRVLRSHTAKIAQVLFMDSLMGSPGIDVGEAEYQTDLRRMRMYTDVKNASLYSSLVEGEFRRPNELITPEFFHTFRTLAHGRVRALESMYLVPIRAAGGLPAMLERMDPERLHVILATLTGRDGRDALEKSRATGDDSEIRALFDRLLDAAKFVQSIEPTEDVDE
jgi:AbiV family abortive infection protein